MSILDDSDNPPQLYASYNGLSRKPMLMGIPYMAGLAVFSFSILLGLAFSHILGPMGWLVSIIGIPILLFIRSISTTDDRAIDIVLIEAKWVLFKIMGGNSKYFGKTMLIAPISYGRKFKNVKRYFEKTIKRREFNSKIQLPY